MKLNLPVYPEPTDSRYSMHNTGGVEIEVGDFLYGLVRMVKPENVLETGTHKGISAAYIASALRDNSFGKLITLEYEQGHYNDAFTLFHLLKLGDWINAVLQDSSTFEVKDNEYDLMFLDTEPNLRFGELLRFWHGLKPGGIVMIHDLGPHMGQTGAVVEGMVDWPFGTLPEEIKKLMETGQLVNIHFRTPRGLYLGQKRADDFYEWMGGEK